MDEQRGESNSNASRFRFSLLSLLLLVTLACIGLGFYQATRRYRVTAYLEVSPSASAGALASQNDVVCAFQSQLALVRSPAVLSAALQRPSLSNLRSLKGKSDPATWLADRLSVQFPSDGEILELKFEGRGLPIGDDDVKILDAVIQAYKAPAEAPAPGNQAPSDRQPPVRVRIIQPAIMSPPAR